MPDTQLLADSTPYPVRPSLKLALMQLTFLMLAVTLLVDSVNGFFLSGMGFDPKLSALFKLVLIGVALYQLGAESPKVLAWCFFTLLMFSIGPIFTLVDTLDVIGFIDDFTSGLKILTALLVFVYVCLMAEKYPDKVEQYGKLALKTGFLILLANIILGLLGFGFSSYGDAEQGDDDAVGIKGFFYAGNEVSGIFVVLYGLVLHFLWQKRKFIFLLFSLLTLVSGLLIATKAAMVAAVLLIFAIPLVNERNRLLNLTALKLKLIVPLVLLASILAVVLIPIFESTGLLNRFIWFYEKKGVIGIILSGRDEFIIAMMSIFERYANFADVVFGFSKTGLGLLTKNAMEIDPIDMYLWHGLFGLAFFLLNAIIFLHVSYQATRLPQSRWAPCVLIINILLIGVSFVAGHIFTSGMLAPLFGLVNGLAYLDLVKARNSHA